MFRFLVLSTIFILSSIQHFAQGIEFEKSLDEAFALSQSLHKPVMIEYYNPDCSVCKRIEPVINKHEVAAFYNYHFINCRINNEVSEETKFITDQKLHIQGTPTFLFFDENKNLLHFAGANPDPAYYIQEGKNALDTNKQAATVAYRYEHGERKISSLFLYAQLAQMYQQDSLERQIANDLYDKLDKAKIGSKESFIILKTCVHDIENGFFTYWIQHMEEASAFADKSHGITPSAILGQIISTSINRPESNNWSIDKIHQVKEWMVLTKLSEQPNLFLWRQEITQLFKKHLDKDALDIGHELMNDSSQVVSSKLFMIQFFLNASTSKANLATFRNWLFQCKSTSNSEFDNLQIALTECMLLAKDGNKSAAKQKANQLLVQAKTKQLDDTSIQQFLKSL